MQKALLFAAMLTAPLCVPGGALAQNVKQKDAPAASAPADTMAQAIALSKRAEALLMKGDANTALPLLAEALRLTREARGETHRDTLTMTEDYAFTLQRLGRFADAEPLLAETLRIRTTTAGERDPDRLFSLYLYSSVLTDLGRNKDAERMFAEGLRLQREVLGPNHPDTLDTMSGYAEVLHNLGRTAEAEPLFAEVLASRRSQLGERHPRTLVSLNDYAFILRNLGRYAEAEPLYAEALRIGREVQGESHPATLAALTNLAELLVAMGQPEKAAPLYAEALSASREVLGDAHPNTVATLAGYSTMLSSLGRHAEAEPLAAEALRLRRATLGNGHPDTLLSINNHATVLAELKRWSEAEPLFAELVDRTREAFGKRHPGTLTVMGNHAFVLQELGRTTEALARHAEALELSREVLGDAHPSTVMKINNYALLLKKLGREQEAEPLYREALQNSRAVLGDAHSGTLVTLENYAIFLRHFSRAGEALPLARELVGTLRKRSAALSADGLRGSEQSGRERAERQSSESFFADVLWDIMESDNTQIALREEAFTALQLASSGAATQAVADAAAARFASSKGLADVVRERRDLAREWAEVEAALVTAEAGGEGLAADRTRLRNRLAAIDARLGDIDERLAREAPQFFAILRQQSVSITELRARLGTEEAVLFIVPGPGGTHSMAVTREGINWRRSDLDEAEVASAVGALREGLEIKGGGELPEFSLARAHDLYRELIAPVEDGLAGKRRVYVVADGALSRLPLGVLVTSTPADGADPTEPEVLRGAAWLADRYALVQLPSLQSLVYIRAFASPSDKGETGAGFIGFGAPELQGRSALRGARSATLAPLDAANLAGSADTALMDPAALRRLAALPGTRIELERVRQAIGAEAESLRLGPAMTESAIRSADLAGVRILHLATHAFTSEEAGSLTEPGLVFTPPAAASAADDGYLAASEVVTLALGSARWVVLSACNTASPSGRPGESGLSGLAQAFFYAGAQSLLVSHWPVFDDIAPVITLETLRTSAAGMPQAEALQAAQRKVREDPALDAAHPAVWAPFSLVGEGR